MLLIFLVVIAALIVTLQKAIFKQFSFNDLPTLFDLALFEMAGGFLVKMLT